MPAAAGDDFRWEDLDQRLLSPKTNDLAEEMHKRVAAGERKIEFDIRQSGNAAGYLTRLFAFHEKLTDEWAERLYTAHCEAWVRQNRTVSAAFIRAVRNQAIAQLIATRKSAVQSEVNRRGIAIGQPPNPVALRDWNLRMDRLAAHWSRKLEAEAVACEYRASGEAARRQEVEAKNKANSDDVRLGMVANNRKKPIDRWLSLGALAVGGALYLLPKTEPVIIGCCLLIWGSLAHPFIKFWWIEDRKWRQFFAATILTIGVVFLGLYIKPEKRQEILPERSEPPQPVGSNAAQRTGDYEGTRLGVQLLSDGGEGSPVTGASFVLQNMDDVRDEHIYISFWAPSRITDVIVDSPERVHIISGGPKGIGPGHDTALELSVPELAPHETRLIRIKMIAAPLRDVSVGMSSTRCGAKCKNVFVLRPLIFGPVVNQSQLVPGPKQKGPPAKLAPETATVRSEQHGEASGAVGGNINQGPCSITQIGGSNNQAMTNCIPPQRTISEADKKVLIDVLSQHHGAVAVGSLGIDPASESLKFANALFDISRAAGWTMKPNRVVPMVHSSTRSTGRIYAAVFGLGACSDLVSRS